MSCPNCGGTFVLMRKIYSKLYPEETNYGKHSPFMEYVKTHWMDPLDNCTSFSVGMGLPYFLATPRVDYEATNKMDGSIVINNLEIGKPFDIAAYSVEGTKTGCAYDFNHNYLAQIGENTFVPLKDFEIEPMEFLGYTKNFLKNPTTEQKSKNYNQMLISLGKPLYSQYNIISEDNVNITKASEFEYGLEKHDGEYFVFADKDLKNFTLQFVVSMGDIIEAAPVEEVQGDVTTYSVGDQKIGLINIPESKEYLYFCVGGLKATSLDNVFVQYGPGTKQTTSFRVMSNPLPRRLQVSIGGTSNIIHLTETDVAVITLSLSGTRLLGYYNGNLIFSLPLEGVSFSLGDLAIKTNMVKDASADNILAYNKVLS